MDEQEDTSIRLTKFARDVIAEYSARCGTTVKDFIEEFAIQAKKGLDDMDEGRLIYLWAWDLRNTMLHLYLSPMVKLGLPVGIPEIEVLAGFDYIRDPKTGRIIDCREEPSYLPQLEIIRKQIAESKKVK